MRVTARVRRLLENRAGGITIVAAFALPVMIGAAALAVDIGSAALDARRLQGMADAAALAAALDPSQAEALAKASVVASGWTRPVRIVAQPGRYSIDAAIPASKRFIPDAAALDAVRVTLNSDTPTFFARFFGRSTITLARTATGARERLAAFSVGGRLAGLNGGVLNALLSAMTGGEVRLSLVDYEALASANVDATAWLDALAIRLGAQAASRADLLNRTVDAQPALAALGDAVGGGAGNAIQRLAASVDGRQVRLGDLIDLGPYAARAGGGAGLVQLDALSAVSAILRGGAGRQTISFNADGLSGLSGTRVTLAFGEPERGSPWVAIDGAGQVIVRTAQMRALVVAELISSGLPGVSGLASVRVPLFVEAARAEARLADIACPAADRRSVTLEARAAPVSAALAEAEAARLGDFSRAMPLSDAKLIRLPLVEVTGRADLDAGAAEPWQRVRFDWPEIRDRTAHTVTTARPVEGVARSLASNLKVRARVGLLLLPLDPLAQAVAGQVAAAAPALDALVALVSGVSGVRLGQADVRVTGVRCGTAALVA